MKLLILGHGQHGKDTVAELLQQMLGLSFCSSSWFAMEKAVWPHFQHYYRSRLECFEDRRNRREEWRRWIREYNTPDLCRLQRELLAENDMYVGMRDAEEYAAGKHLYDHILWVDARTRELLDPSMHILYNPAEMSYIDNNRDEVHLRRQVEAWVSEVVA